jgi:hypothetical protein
MGHHDARPQVVGHSLALAPWRVGRSVGRTVYAQLGHDPGDADVLIGVFDNAALALEAVAAHNARLAVPPQ